MLDIVRVAGVWGYLILIGFAFGLVFAILHASKASKWTLILALLGAAIPPSVGLVGSAMGRANVERAIASADPKLEPLLRAKGNAEAAIPQNWGLIFGGVLLVPIGIGELRRRGREKREAKAAKKK
ncbi:MAG: hypothetical protein KC503_10160 [Myxococcales bacterium]|nr:hypothetical protein [Myxococcales bacterium]